MDIDEPKTNEAETDLDNETKTIDEVENKDTNENKNTAPESSFKKPLLIGKIGRLPKRITEALKPNDSSGSETSTDPLKTPNTNLIEDPPKLEIPAQKSDTFSNQYKEPDWSGLPESTGQNYNFEVLKDGSIIQTLNLMDKSHWVFGRLAGCDISMQHPTISRYHAVLQYRSQPSEKEETGFYIYDLGSTHGTFLNKNRLRPRVYVRIQVGHILKLGCSTRSYLLNGPEEDSEKESELSVTELKQKRKEELERRENERRGNQERMEKEEEERRKKEEERGVDWGLGEDADEETDISENPYAQSNNEDLYLDDPKKTLRGFFEREGLNLEYDCSEQGMGQYLCKVELPIDDERGKPIYAEVIHKGKKKEAVVQCALEACRILDRYGLLRQANHESRKRKVKDWAENDYYDSDDDTFLDRTGEIEKRREKRMNAKHPKKAETYESLMEKEREIADSIRKLEKQLSEAQEKIRKSNMSSSEEDSLDAFMKDLKDSKPDKTTISKFKSELTKLKLEHAKVIKLVNIAKPASLPPLVPQYTSDASSQSGKSRVLPIFGKRKKLPVVVPQKTSSHEIVDDDEEEEEMMEIDSNTEKTEDIEKSNEISEDRREVETSVDEDSLQQKSAYGLQKPNEIKKPKLSTTEDLSMKIVQDKCKRTLDRIFDQVKVTSELISRLGSSESRKEKLENLVSLITKEGEVILENIEKIHPEESEKAEDQHESSARNEASTEVERAAEDLLKKKKNQRRIQQRLEKAEIEKRKGYAEDAKKEDYSMWVPPKNQTGDGKTKLNEKYGY